ncbi:MAG TPA: Sec-independent protein translocase subunit TatA [Candidatus Dietzia intestinigallinarum]|nr:Sec-independent protein translocase subunit TatA [Candidatus Dietzia intestinigallinarum]
MGALSIWHWLIVLAVVLLLFGSKKLPDAARGLGRSMRIFKSEMKEMQNDGTPAEQDQTQAITQAQPDATRYAQPQAQPYQQPAPQQPPVAQPQPHPAPGQAQPPRGQQYGDPTAPYNGGQVQ